MRKRSILQMLAIGLVFGALTALVAYFIPWLPDPAAEEAGLYDNVYWVVTIICVAIFALVAGVSIYAVWRFRAGPDDEEDGKPIHGHTGLEIMWTAIPTALVTAITIYSAIVLVQVERLPEAHRVVEVHSVQFAWSFTYPDLEITSGELVLPRGEPTRLELTAADVIHSFWVPQWRVKQDAVPGIVTRLSVTPSRPGTYPVICTELCGLGHAFMRARARVVEPAEFEAWVAEQREAAAAPASAGGGADAGQELFLAQGCGSCHALADAGTDAQVGPDLDESLAGADEAFVHESIVEPDAEIAEGYQPGVMPQDYDERMSEEQLDALVAYLLESAGGG